MIDYYHIGIAILLITYGITGISHVHRAIRTTHYGLEIINRNSDRFLLISYIIVMSISIITFSMEVC